MSGAVIAVSTQLGLSLLWGFSASLLPSVCFAWYGFRQYGGAHRARAALHAVYRAEALKFLITAALFAAVFVQVDRINLPVFFLAFVCGQVASWLVMVRALKERRR